MDDISYAEWGQAFFRHAVTEARVLSGVNTLAGQPIDFGPVGAGPGRIAKIAAKGKIGEASIETVAGELIGYRVWLPVSLDFAVDLQLETHRFQAELKVPIVLSAIARHDLSIFIAATPPRSSDVQVALKAEGLRASITQRVANVEGELKRFVAKYVGRELEKDAVVQARTIDVARAIDGAYATIEPTGESAVAATGHHPAS